MGTKLHDIRDICDASARNIYIVTRCVRIKLIPKYVVTVLRQYIKSLMCTFRLVNGIRVQVSMIKFSILINIFNWDLVSLL